MTFLADLAASRRVAGQAGITSICSAHPMMIEAALLRAKHDNAPAFGMMSGKHEGSRRERISAHRFPFNSS